MRSEHEGDRVKRVPGRRLLTAGLLLTLGLTACGGPVQAGAAAVVGQDRLDGTTFTERVRDGLALPEVGPEVTADVPGYQRSLLSQYVSLRLLERAAEQNGVEVDRGDVDGQLAQLESAAGGAEELRERARTVGLTDDQLREVALLSALSNGLAEVLPGGQVSESDLRAAYQAGIDNFQRVRVAEILLASEAEAQTLLPQAQAGTDADFAALAEARSLDPRLADTGLQPASAFAQQGQPDVAERAFAAEPGDVFVTTGESGALLVRVLQQETTSFEDARAELEDALAGPAQQQALETALRDVEQDVEIKVNPRYGRWDSVSLAVVDDDDELSRPSGGSPALDPADELLQPPRR